MDFKFTEEEEIFRKTVADFAKKELAPIAQEIDEKAQFPMNVYKKAGELGFLGLRFPEQWGGSAANTIMECIFLEEMNRVEAGVPGAIFSSVLAVTPINDHGTEAQKKKYLIPTNKGEMISALGATEPNAGSDISSMQTTARKDGDSYIINGTKMFITNGPIADFISLAAKTDRNSKHRGISLLIIEKGTPGFTVSRKLNLYGTRSAIRGELVFEDCRIPQDNLVGEENRGFYYLMECFNREKIMIGASCVGIAQAAFDEALQYAKERVQFGQAIGKFQAIQHMLADMAANIEIGKLLTYKAAWMLDEGMEATKEASYAKLISSEMANQVTYQSLQIHGGYGYSMEFPIQRHVRDVRLYTIGGGTSQIMRRTIAKKFGL